MDFFIDGRAETVYCGPGTTLKELLDYYHEQLLKQHRVVVEILVNGIQLDSRSETTLQRTAAGQVARLELTTSTMRKVAIKVFRETVSHLPRLIEGFDQVARRLEQDRREPAWETLRLCLENWRELLCGLATAGEAIGLEFDELSAPDGRPFTEVLEEMHELLRGLVDQVGEQPSENLVDQIDHQVIPLMEDCEEVVRDMIDLSEQPLH